MLRPIAVDVKALEGHRILITFDTGEKKVFDGTPYIKGEWYSELSDEKYLKTVRTNGYSVEWKNGQDLCPDEIYYCSSSAP